MQFVFDMLAHRPDLAPTCGRWEHEEWGRMSGRPLAVDVAKFTAARPDGIPLTILALTPQGEAVGMVSLWKDDCPLRPGITPWLASLYVTPAARGHGLGTALFARAEEEARRLGISSLHLVTQHSEAHYAARGWAVVERIDGTGSMADAVIMQKTL